MQPASLGTLYLLARTRLSDKISVYSARVNMGTKLGERLREWEDLDIDVVIPIPETSCDIALEIARILDKPIAEAS